MQIYWPTIASIATVAVVLGIVFTYYYKYHYHRHQHQVSSTKRGDGGDYVKVAPLEPPAAATAAVAAAGNMAGAMGSVVVPVSLKAKEGVEFIMGGGEV